MENDQFICPIYNFEIRDSEFLNSQSAQYPSFYLQAESKVRISFAAKAHSMSFPRKANKYFLDLSILP